MGVMDDKRRGSTGLIITQERKHRQWDNATTEKRANCHVDNCGTSEHLHLDSEECMAL